MRDPEWLFVGCPSGVVQGRPFPETTEIFSVLIDKPLHERKLTSPIDHINDM